MALQNQTGGTEASSTMPVERVTTLISCSGVRPLASGRPDGVPANENRWFDRIAFRKHWYANLAAIAVTGALIYGGLWIVHEFVRLQKLEACFEAGRRDCLPLDMARRGR